MQIMNVDILGSFSNYLSSSSDPYVSGVNLDKIFEISPNISSKLTPEVQELLGLEQLNKGNSFYLNLNCDLLFK